MVEMRVGQQDGVELVRVEREGHAVADRFVRAALEHPAVDEDAGLGGLEEVLGAGDGRGAAEEVDLHGRMVTARGVRRVSSASMGLTEVERSYGELLAAFGDVVVARGRGAPAEPPGGSIASVVRRYRRMRRAFGPALAALTEPARAAAEDRRALATMRATLAWLDEMSRRRGAADERRQPRR